MATTGNARFPLGQVLATPGALQALEDSGQSAAEFLDRHARGDWGDLCDDDKRLNDQAVIDGGRLLSAYGMCHGGKLWIITEAANDAGQRAAITILLPEEY